MEKETKFGKITVDHQVFSEIVAEAVTKCFGVRGLAGDPYFGKAGVETALTKDKLKNSIKIRFDNAGKVYLGVHIVVNYGINILTLGKSIIKEVTYRVTRQTGYQVAEVNVFVDGIA